MQSIKYYDRNTKKYETEKVAGEGYLNWIYSSTSGMRFLEAVLKKKFFSALYGRYCDSRLSKKKIIGFVNEFNIDMSICKKSIKEFMNFNDFFVRELSQASRRICTDDNTLISPADGKMLAYKDINIDELIQVKGYTYSLKELIGDIKTAEEYKNGTCLIIRLCPSDYHRFHFIDKGICSNTKRINGCYYSVNPIALKKVKKLFCENKREWCTFHSQNFGDILYVEVGATCVGSIVQTYTPGRIVSKGDEKGYFKFGGSTVILFFKKSRIEIDNEIVEQTASGFETCVLMGENIGSTS